MSLWVLSSKVDMKTLRGSSSSAGIKIHRSGWNNIKAKTNHISRLLLSHTAVIRRIKRFNSNRKRKHQLPICSCWTAVSFFFLAFILFYFIKCIHCSKHCYTLHGGKNILAHQHCDTMYGMFKKLI